MPKVCAREHKLQVPAAALWITNILVQCFLIVTIFSQYAFDLSLEMTSALTLIPYLLVAGYALKLVLTRETYEPGSTDRVRDMTWAAIAVVYTFFMLLSGGLKHLVLACILLAPGTLMFVLAQRERRAKLFAPLELALLGVFVVGAAAGIYGLATGMITI